MTTTPHVSAPWRARKKARPTRTHVSQAVARTRVLALLVATPGLLTKEISEVLGLGWSTTSHVLRALESLGFICRIRTNTQDTNTSRNIRWCLVEHWYLFETSAPPKPPKRVGGRKRIITADDLSHGVDGNGGVSTADVTDSRQENE